MLVNNPRVETNMFLRGESVEHPADAIGFAGNVFRGAPLRAFEHHMLDEMRDAVEIAGLAARTVQKPYAHGDRPDMGHLFGDYNKAI